MKSWIAVTTGALFILVAAGLLLTGSQHEREIHHVAASAETAPVPSNGDAADDPAIWRHPVEPELSTIIGTDKDSGLAVYDLAGRELQFVPDGEMNNVDLRDGFPLAGESISLVTAGNQSDSTIAIYRINTSTRMLENVAARALKTCAPYGSCMYRSAKNGKFYYFVNSRSGTIEQWELFDNGAGKVEGKKVRSYEIGLRPEGCVADDELGYFYLGVEEKGIRKYGAETEDGALYLLVDQIKFGGPLTRQVEGLTIYYQANQRGYLIASSQGTDKFVIYRREDDNDYLGAFRVVAGNGIDGVTHTDGIDVSSAAFGPDYPLGLFIAQDDTNDAGNQNFKIVSWKSVAEIFGPALVSGKLEHKITESELSRAGISN